MADFDRRRKRICRFCEDKIKVINYHDDRLLKRFTNERGKIVPRRISGNCARHQRLLTIAIKRARHLAIMPFTSEFYR
ncbi:MAG: 30S ribosomal protein S18 [Candidatus Zixiibacteriota bacterium]|nr:MAG: 30S ribosomal protein S18 [candidate division Zixibacteria bacterium]HDL04165.1 30S ribosomal protein S18 [candidate division Zixibacteria bacterium]